MSSLPKTYLTPEEYLEIERKAEFKSEYFQGEMFAMAGAKAVHNLIAAHLLGRLDQEFRSRPCLAYTSDMRVRVSTTGLYAYPDVVAVCGEPRFLDEQQDTLLNPSLLAEVLSPSTEVYDRVQKFELYRSIESLAEYLLLSTDRVHADLFTRQLDGRWLMTSVGSLEDSLDLQSVGCRISLADLYEKVEFTASPPVMRLPG